MVRALLGRGGVNLNELDMLGRTPLHLAAENKHGEVVKTLLGREDVDLDEPDMLGGTPLFYATENRHEGVVALIQPPESTPPAQPKGWLLSASLLYPLAQPPPLVQ